MKSINRYIACFAVAAVAASTACNKVFDKNDLAKIPPDLVFSDSNIARLNLDGIYESNLPGWGGTTNIGNLSGVHGELSEESYGENKYFEGTVLVSDVQDFGVKLDPANNYGKIRNINMFLQAVRASAFEDGTKRAFIGQALFWRAWRYWDMVRIYGGVPIVLTPLEGVGDQAKQDALLPRDQTSACIKQIVADLDSAIAYLPGKYPSTSDWGHITSGAAAAVKGRVLLTYASPEFNPGDLQDRWQAAYDANLKAKQILDANGYGLNASYDQMWFTEVNNPEAVMITGYNTQTADQLSKNNGWDNSTRPSYLGTGGGSNQPSWDLVKAYAMKDGKDSANSSFHYSDSFFYKNRDPRFDKTIAYNGCTWPINGNPNYKLWTYYFKDKKDSKIKTTEVKATNTGFYCRKAIITGNPVNSDPKYVGTDWMEIRYAEVLLNLGEAAVGINKVGQTDEGYAGMIAVRKRAGITANSDNLYGLTPGMSRSQLFDAILYERQIEFAFEGKRFWDLRRWKKFESVLNGKRRSKVYIRLRDGAGFPAESAVDQTLNEFSNPASPKFRDVTDLDFAYTNYFQVSANLNPTGASTSLGLDKINVVLDTKYSINWRPEYYFFGIPTAAITNNPNLEQNNTWSGTFDPLK